MARPPATMRAPDRGASARSLEASAWVVRVARNPMPESASWAWIAAALPKNITPRRTACLMERIPQPERRSRRHEARPGAARNVRAAWPGRRRRFSHRTECLSSLQLGDCVGVIHSVPVRALGGHGVVGVGYVNNARIDGGFFSALSQRIAGAVPIFVVQLDCGEECGEPLHTL